MGFLKNIFGPAEMPKTPKEEEAEAMTKAMEKHSTYEHKEGAVIEKKPSGEIITHDKPGTMSKQEIEN